MTLLRDINTIITIRNHTTRLMSFRLQTQSQTQSQNFQEIRKKTTSKLLG